MNELKLFENPEFRQIRVIELNGKPWFVGKDIAVALGFKNPRQAISSNIDDEDRGVHEMDTTSGVQEMTIINESGLYSLIFICTGSTWAKDTQSPLRTVLNIMTERRVQKS